MIKNMLRSAFRYLFKNKSYSLLNIIGLTIGLTAFWQVMLYVQRETSYDHFHKKGDRIFRAATDVITPTEKRATAFSSGALAVEAQRAFPEVESTVRTAPASLLFTNGSIKFQEDNCLFVDSSFFNLFDFPLIAGNPDRVLVEPYEVILSQSTAKKYFGSTNPIGKTLQLSVGRLTTKVTGVMKDFPVNSQFKADILLSMPTITAFGGPAIDKNWANVNFQTYFLLRPAVNYKLLEAKMAPLLEQKAGELMRQTQTHYKVTLEPLKEVYLHSQRVGGVSGNLANVYIFATIGLFILLIAGINFINLSTARSTERAKEVGVRKLLGARKRQLTFQFITESVLLAMGSFILSIIFTSLLLPILNHLAGKIVSSSLIDHPVNIIVMLMIALLLGISAGVYPAFVLSSFKPITVLKGKFASSTKGLYLRRALVTLQFTICIAMIISTIIVYGQLQYTRHASLGFNNEQMLVIDTHWDQNRLTFRDQVASIPQISSLSFGSNIPGDDIQVTNPVKIANSEGVLKTTIINQVFVDYNYLPAFNMKIIAGRNFSPAIQSDSSHAIIINESLLHQIGYQDPDQVIGKTFVQNNHEGTIIGVLKNFHFRSFKVSIQPLSFSILPGNWRYLCLKVNTSQLQGTLTKLENIWKTTIPQRPFSYYFADDYFNKQYQTDQNFGKLFICFSILTIFISCLGLVGLSAYSTLQRRKEIGVRKVLGASKRNIVRLLSLEFLQLIAIAFISASLITWYPIQRWLQEFQYRSAIQWWYFLAAGVLVLLIAFATISIHVFKAACSNPVNSLKTTE